MNFDIEIATLSDEQLLLSLKACVADEKRSLVKVLVRINEVARRELYSKQMHYASLYAFTLKELGYSEDAAYRRIAVAQAATKYPILYRRLASGRISLTAAAKIAKHLKPENCKELLDYCERAPRREIDRLLARLDPALDQPRDRVRFLGTQPRPAIPAAEISLLPLSLHAGDRLSHETLSPTDVERERTAGDGSAAETGSAAGGEVGTAAGGEVGTAAGAGIGAVARVGALAAIGAECSRVEVRFPADEIFYRRLERARALLRHKYPAGRCGEVISYALEVLLDRIDPQCSLERRKRRVQQAQPYSVAAKDLNAPGGRLDNPTGDWANSVPAGGPGSAAGGKPNTPGRAPDNTRHRLPRRAVPSRVRDEVWNRDGSRCTFVGADGQRCEETDFLEIDHIIPVARGGRSDDACGLRLLCRNHNGMEARRILGAERMALYTRKG